MAEKLDSVFFPEVEGSITSNDGQTFFLRVKRETGSALMIGFPHEEIPNIVECAAMQADQGKDKNGAKLTGAFQASSFQLGRSPDGEPVLTIMMGERARISFLLPPDMPGQLTQSLQRLAS